MTTSKAIFVILLIKTAFFSQGAFALDERGVGVGEHSKQYDTPVSQNDYRGDAEGNADSGEQQTYRFTQYFNQKFKSTLPQQRAYEVSGNAASSVMGPTNLGGSRSNFNNNYWGFINDLSSSSGTGSTSTNSEPSCPEKVITSPSGERGYLPPGINGKYAATLGKSYRCSGSVWIETTASGDNGMVPQRTSGCAPKIITKGSCQFSFPGMNHMETMTDAYGQLFGDAANVEGEAAVQCVNGSINLTAASCEPVSCSPDDIVSWRGVNQNAAHEEYPRCRGQIQEGGFVTPDNEPQFFSNPDSAAEHTRISVGLARFACTTNGWRVIPDTSTCTYKPSEDLSCGKPGFAGDREIYLCN